MVNTRNHLGYTLIKTTANIDEAMDIVGTGWYNLKYCLVLAMLLISFIIEQLGNSLTLPAAVCDLQMTDSQRGLIISLSYIGILLTSYPWGYLVDTRGRRQMLIYSSLAIGIFSTSAGLMPNLISFAICKFLSALCLACPSSAPYTYIGEMLPSKNRDVLLSVLNSAQLAGSAIVPLLAWAILPLNINIPFGIYNFRPWRLLTIIYAMFFIVLAIVLTFCPESPKFLVSQNKHDEALKVLQNMYAGNKGERPEDYPIKELIVPPDAREKGNFLTSLRVQTVPLLKWSYLKWILLNGSLLFGVCLVLNGLNMWVPDVLNRVLSGGGGGKTACAVIHERVNQTSPASEECNDTIDNFVLIVSFIARLCCAVVALIASSVVKYIGKKKLIILTFLFIGVACISINLITRDILFAVILSSTSIVALTVGPVNAYAVEIFPTHLRGMAVSLSMMLGRIGSVIGASATGLMMANYCETMFYSFGGYLFLCSTLAFLLPSSKATPDIQKGNDNETS